MHDVLHACPHGYSSGLTAGTCYHVAIDCPNDWMRRPRLGECCQGPVPSIIFAATGVLVQYHHCFACVPQLAICTLSGFVYMLHP